MLKKPKLVRYLFVALVSIFMMSCGSDGTPPPPTTPTTPTTPRTPRTPRTPATLLTAEIHYNIDDDLKVAFQGLSGDSVEWSWDFGDGTTSREQNPVHDYARDGSYVVVFVARDAAGSEKADTVRIELKITDYVLLTGGTTATEGKTWRISSAHSPSGAIYPADGFASPPLFKPLPPGVLDFYFGLPEVYDDVFTFYYDGTYEIDVQADGTAFSGVEYQTKMHREGNIDNRGSAHAQELALCTAFYTPEPDLKFSYIEKKNFVIETFFDTVTYKDVSILDFTGNAFFVVWEYNTEVMIVDITEHTMRVRVHASREGCDGKPVIFLELNLEVVE